jgi:mannose-6-phosphate isomerase-like protein (cupin superfamily)
VSLRSARTRAAGQAGPWIIPHRHDRTSESFYVLDGTFDFVCGDQQVTMNPGDYILIRSAAAI